MPLIEKDCDVIYKVLIVGDSGVGKTAILDCLMGRDFNENPRPTVGVDFVRKIVEADGALVQLRIWDTAGLEKFRSITRLQYRGIQGLIVVYDVTDETSFHSVAYWLSNIQHIRTPYRHPYEPLPFLVIGNKSDVVSEKKISSRQGLKLAKKEMALGFHEVSAKTGNNIFKAFQNLAFHITDISHPKLMKSYHRNFIRPAGIKPNNSADVTNFNRLSAPVFSSSSSTFASSPSSSSTSPRQRYSLWDPLIPWTSYSNTPTKSKPKKSRLRRIQLALPFFRRKEKRTTAKTNNDIELDLVLLRSGSTNSKSKTTASGHRDTSRSMSRSGSTKASSRHEKKRFRRFFRPRNKNRRDKKSGKKRKQDRGGGRNSSISFKQVRRRMSFNSKDKVNGGVRRDSKYRRRTVRFRTRLVRFLCSCFMKSKTY